jgi:hypothetical protein
MCVSKCAGQWVAGKVGKLYACKVDRYIQYLLLKFFNTGFDLLYIIYIDGQLMEKWIDFVEIKFHLNGNIEWYCMQFDLKFHSL